MIGALSPELLYFLILCGIAKRDQKQLLEQSTDLNIMEILEPYAFAEFTVLPLVVWLKLKTKILLKLKKKFHKEKESLTSAPFVMEEIIPEKTLEKVSEIGHTCKLRLLFFL